MSVGMKLMMYLLLVSALLDDGLESCLNMLVSE
jgi:hypothetical protein